MDQFKNKEKLKQGEKKEKKKLPLDRLRSPFSPNCD